MEINKEMGKAKKISEKERGTLIEINEHIKYNKLKTVYPIMMIT